MPSLAANISVAPETFSPFVPGFGSNYLFGLCLTLSLGLVLLSRVSLISREPSYPIVTLERDANDSNPAEEDFRLRGNEILEKGRAEYPGQPFWVHSDDGDLLILPGRLANDMRNVDELSFMEALKERLHASLPGFEPFQASSRGDQLVQVVTRKQLTKALSTISVLSQHEMNETADKLGSLLQARSLDRFPTRRPTLLIFGSVDQVVGCQTSPCTAWLGCQLNIVPEWKEHHLYTEILDIVARISARVFLGEHVCRNQDWLDITKSYTVQCFRAASALRQKPPSLRFLLHWFDPSCRMVRSYVTKARQIIAPVIRRRQELRREALARGDPLPTLTDAIDWFEEEADGKPYDPEIVQLTLSMAAIHTTTDLLCETMTNIARNPELFTQLREEISRVLKAEGWVKTSLYNLKLLDSVVKESQRLKPLNSGENV
jgi:cytochrome P450